MTTAKQPSCYMPSRYRYRFTHTWPQCWKRESGQHYTPATLLQGNRPHTHCKGSWVGSGARLDTPWGFEPWTIYLTVRCYTKHAIPVAQLPPALIKSLVHTKFSYKPNTKRPLWIPRQDRTQK